MDLPPSGRHRTRSYCLLIRGQLRLRSNQKKLHPQRWTPFPPELRILRSLHNLPTLWLVPPIPGQKKSSSVRGPREFTAISAVSSEPSSRFFSSGIGLYMSAHDSARSYQ